MRNWKLRAAALAALAFVAVSCLVSGRIPAVNAEPVLNGPDLEFLPGTSSTLSGKTIKGVVTVCGGANVFFDNCTFIGSEDNGTGDMGVRILSDGKSSMAILNNATFVLKCDNGGTTAITLNNRFSGGTAGVDSVMTSAYTVVADGAPILKVNNDPDVEESERLIEAWFSIGWIRNVLLYRVSFTPDRAGLIATHNVKIEYSGNLVYFPNVLEISGETKSVTLDFCEGHEELAARFASENSVPVEGSKVKVQVAQGNVLGAIDELFADFSGYFGGTDFYDKDEKLFRGIFGIKPLKEYSDWEEYDLYKTDTTRVADGYVFYLLWQKPIKKVSVTVQPLVCGQNVTAYHEIAGPFGFSVRSWPAPSVTVEGDAFAYERGYHNTDVAFWADNEDGSFAHNTSCGGLYSASPARGGDECYAAVYLRPNMGYCFPDFGDFVFINGKAANNYDNDRFTGPVPVVHPDEDNDGRCDVCEAKFYPVTVTATAGGSASPSVDQAAGGENVKLYAEPAAGYRFREWKVASGDVTISGESFQMPEAAVVIEAVFEPDPDQEFAVNVSDDGNGKAYATPASGPAETSVTLKAEPDEGFKFKEWKVISGTVTIDGDTFSMPAEDVEIKAVFVPVICKLTVTLDPPEGGSADGGGSCIYGTYGTLSAEPAKGYEFTGWVKDGSVISKDLEYNFKVTSDGDYTATFAKVVYIVTKGAGGTWVKGSSDGFTVAVKRSINDDKCFGHFTGVSLDGNALAVSAYKAEQGSTIVTLGTETLEALSEGDHSVTVEFDDGEVTAAISVAVEKPERENPVTGVSGHPGMIAVMSALSLGAAVSLRRKRS